MTEQNFKVGAKTWRGGNEVTITSEPFEEHGGMWQNGIDENDKEYTLPTPGQLQKNIERQRSADQEQQAGFKRVGELMRESGLW